MTYTKTICYVVASVVLIFLLVFSGASLLYMATTAVKTSNWVTEIEGKTILHDAAATVEVRGMPPFAEHLEPYQKSFRCNCILETGDQPVAGGFGGGFGSDKTSRYWSFPVSENEPFKFRSVTQDLIRQKVVNNFDQTMLDWRISIDGYVSEDYRQYYFRLSHYGGNFAGCDVDHYVEFDPATKMLSLHVREKLFRGKHKRYQFDFELQDAETTSNHSQGR